ncbi:NUDIX domain-containing protein [Synechococcales cyanobacterium C]|uniref:NUDIX domain-containing protein n=1 Tax=Petrachloros mirabilis ULC683 TaxID=2781853 RepID=A0A8K2A6T6_9CYAN|nr:NUDIX hydrolase [Petrachloros mirabilis]NCJ05470.1 NUDIX domain-containing protein [Petrachloros mirabilis ULC683]
MPPRNPAPTVDILIEMIDRPARPIVLIERRNPPYGWAMPGGFVDYGESVEAAACREAAEETCLQVTLLEQFQVYSDPQRDVRQHTLSIVLIATATGQPQAADDAKNLALFEIWQLPSPLCFDHAQILQDYRRYRQYGWRPRL